jgi:hypothetical protein
MPSPQTLLPMCADCKALVGASRRTKPHGNLEYKEGKRCSSMIGAADEAYYCCKVCGHEWMHETGSCGMGWM